MKKYNLLFMFVMLLVGCAEEPKIVAYYPQTISMGSTYATKESELSKNPDIIKTVELYINLYNYSVQTCDFSIRRDCENIDFTKESGSPSNKVIDSGYSIYNQLEVYPQFMIFKQPDSQAYCFIQQDNTSDECILMRRHESDSKIHYFNYKKYMPKTVKLTDEGFLNLVNLFIGTRPVVQKCFADTTLTTAERQTCADNVNKFLVDVATSKIAKCKIKNTKLYNEKMVKYSNYASAANVYDQKTKDEVCTNTKILERTKSDYIDIVDMLFFEWNNRCIIDESVLLQDRLQYRIKEEKKWCSEPYRYINTGIPVFIMN